MLSVNEKMITNSEIMQSQIEKLSLVSAQIDAQLAEGLVSHLQILEAKRSLLTANQELLAVHKKTLDDSVLLYKAMGGGWPVTVVE